MVSQVSHSSIMVIFVYFLFDLSLRPDTLQTTDLALKLIFKMLLLLHMRVCLLSARLQRRGYQEQLSSEQRLPIVKEC